MLTTYLAGPGWGKAAYSYFGAWNCGASLFIWDDRQSFHPLSLLNIINRFPITTMCVPPLAWRQLVTPRCREYYSTHIPKALRECASAGEPLDPEVIRQWQRLTGLSIREGYGQTEAILMCGNYGDFPIKPGSMGKPLPNIPLTVIHPDGVETKAGEEGDLSILLSANAGHASTFFGIFDGYVDDAGQVARGERVVKDTNGQITPRWYMTGDRATRDEDGYLWFVGRADDVINSSGYRIGTYPSRCVMSLIRAYLIPRSQQQAPLK
jgi:acyl-coenzyme A synthetase/AMP-(fatty) acid ligase